MAAWAGWGSGGLGTAWVLGLFLSLQRPLQYWSTPPSPSPILPSLSRSLSLGWLIVISLAHSAPDQHWRHDGSVAAPSTALRPFSPMASPPSTAHAVDFGCAFPTLLPPLLPPSTFSIFYLSHYFFRFVTRRPKLTVRVRASTLTGAAPYSPRDTHRGRENVPGVPPVPASRPGRSDTAIHPLPFQRMTSSTVEAYSHK